MSVQQSALHNNNNNNNIFLPEMDSISHQDPTNLAFPNSLLSTQNTLQKQNIEPMDLSNDILAGFLCFQQDGTTNLDSYQGRGSQRDMLSGRGKQFSDRKALSAFSNRDAKASGFMIDPSFSCGLPKEDQTPYIFNSFTGNNISTMQGNSFFGGSIRNQPSFIGNRFSSANTNMNGNPLMSNYQACIFPGHGYPLEDSSQYLAITSGTRPPQPQPQSYRLNFQQFDQIYNQQQQGIQNESKNQELHLFEKTVLNQLEQPQRIMETMPTMYANSSSSYEVDSRMYPQNQVKNVPSGYHSTNQLFFSQTQGNNLNQDQDENAHNLITYSNTNHFNQQSAMNVNQSNIDFISLMSTAPGTQMPMLDATPHQNLPCSFLNQLQSNNNTNNQHVYVSSGSALNDRQILMSEMKTEQIEDLKNNNEEQQHKSINDNNFTTKLENNQEEQEQQQQQQLLKETQTSLQQAETLNRECNFNSRRRKRANLTQNLKGENNSNNNISESSQIDIDKLKGMSRSILLQQMNQIQSQAQHTHQHQQSLLTNKTTSEMPYSSYFSSGFEQSQPEMQFADNLPQILSQTTIPQAPMYMDHSPLQLHDKINHKQKPQLEEGMACNCSKTKCLKMYCVCFQQGVMCGTTCRCSDCQNSSIFQHERDYAVKDILSRNPDAFKKKIQEIPKSNKEQDIMNELDSEGYMPSQGGLTMVHKKGCNCKRTLCKKKYCECFSAGAKCTPLCRCEGCQNGKNESLDQQGKHINIEGSNIVDYENYNKGHFVSIKTKNNQFGNIKLEIFRPTVQNSNQQKQSENLFKESIKNENSSVVNEQVNQADSQKENISDSYRHPQLQDSHDDDEDKDIGESFINRKKIKVNNEDEESQKEQHSNFPPFSLQSDQSANRQHNNYLSFQSKQLNGSQSSEQAQQSQIPQIQETHMQQLLEINNLTNNSQEQANYNTCILSSERSLLPLVDSNEKKEMHFMEFLAS